MSQFKKALTRFALSIPRSIAPVLNVGSRTFLFRDADIREVLERDKEFTLRQINFENINRHIGPFILGMDDGETYQKDTQVLRSVVRRDDSKRIREFVRRTSDELLDGVSGEFDMVSDFTRLLPLKMVGDYFGVPGPNAADMYRWNRTLFWDVFLELGDNPELRARANKCAEEMAAYLDGLIAELKSVLNGGGRLADNLLTRLLALQQSTHKELSDAWIRGNLSGIFLGALEPTNKSVVNILGQLVHRPKVFEAAQKAAMENDMKKVAGYAWEALRFHPNAPALIRYAEKEQKIGGGDRKERTIRAGKSLFLMTLSAMFDARAVEQPKKFDSNRPFSTYLYFGHGLHTCYGNHVNFVAIPEMVAAVLRRPGLKPLGGKVIPEGPFADKWMWKAE